MEKQEVIQRILECVELGKVNRDTPFPPSLKGQDGAWELTRLALDQGVDPARILNDALITAMERVGEKFTQKKIFVPQMLISAKAMNAAMEHLKPYFQSGQVRRRGRFIIGTVAGDLHDIGKNLVAMIVEGAGWEVIDLGVDVSPQKFKQSVRDHPGAVVGLSALLTTTMHSMRSIVMELKSEFPATKLIIGGAPINEDFRHEIGADGYSPNPQGAVAFLNAWVA